MKLTFFTITVAIQVVFVLSGCFHTQETAIQPTPKPLSIGSFESPSTIVGRIGAPLGSVVTITADVVDTSKAKAKALESVIVLRIRSVNNNPLNPPQEIKAVWFVSAHKQKLADHVTLIGYESGSFQGVPSQAWQHVQPVASQDFHFESEFVILEVGR